MGIVNNQLAYDNFHPSKDKIYRVVTKVVGNINQIETYATTPQILSEYILKYNSVVESACYVRSIGNANFTSAEKNLDIKTAFTQTSFFSVFSFQLTLGSDIQALGRPQTAIITSETANKLFGNNEVIGKTLQSPVFGILKIVGIIKKPPSNTHLNYEMYISMASSIGLERNHKIDSLSSKWSAYYGGYTYVKLSGQSDAEIFGNILHSISDKVFKPVNFPNKEKSILFTGQSILDITPRRSLILDNSDGLSYTSIFVYSIFVILLLLMACLNYSNLTMARIISRSVEVGMRKILGASRKQVILQFIVESTVVCFFSLLVAFVLLPFIPLNGPLGKLSAASRITPIIIGESIIFVFVAGLISGLLPSILLSKFKPLEVLKKATGLKLLGTFNFRKILIGFQFTISFILVTALITVLRQSDFMSKADYGFNLLNTLTFPLKDSGQYELLTASFKNIASVKTISGISTNFGGHATEDINAQNNHNGIKIKLSSFYIDENIIPSMSLTVLAGQNFTHVNGSAYKSDIIINKKACDVLNLGNADQAIGKIIYLDDTLPARISGVIKDFHFENFKQEISPMAFRYGQQKLKWLNVKLWEPIDPNTINLLETTWNRINPNTPATYFYLEDVFKEQQSHFDDISILAFLCIVFLTIGSLGLLGISTYATEIKAKEISIRKTLGASVADIFVLFSREYFILMAITSTIGIPIGWIISKSFLKNFAYKIDINLWMILQSFGFVIIIALLSFGIQVIKVAIKSPVHNLR
jgi:putative ABC transport system permease protein